MDQGISTGRHASSADAPEMRIDHRTRRDPASFRDPSGYVFRRYGRVFRAVDGECFRIVQALAAEGMLQQLVETRILVGTSIVADVNLLHDLEAENPGWDHFLEHDPIAFLTYPYEWSISMLADAALHTLDLQERLLTSGHSLKDATAYNIQFVDGRPIFIDISSIERPPRLDIWLALGQFGRMFTFPLLLYRYRAWDLRSYFLGDINGRDAEQVVRSLGRWGRWLPRNVLDVTLPALLQRRASRFSGDGPTRLEPKARGATAQLLNLRRLRIKVRKFAEASVPRSTWSDYTATCSYGTRAETAKQAIVGRYLELARPSCVLDIGCNTGTYSYLAARLGARVIAADADHDAVDFLYRRLRGEPAAITPLVLDLSQPSPAIGYGNRERPSFLSASMSIASWPLP